jgi:hypothetical protein
MESVRKTNLDSSRARSGGVRVVGKKGSKAVVDEKRIAIERSSLIWDRQCEIERVLDRHDNYVRGVSY